MTSRGIPGIRVVTDRNDRPLRKARGGIPGLGLLLGSGPQRGVMDKANRTDLYGSLDALDASRRGMSGIGQHELLVALPNASRAEVRARIVHRSTENSLRTQVRFVQWLTMSTQSS